MKNDTRVGFFFVQITLKTTRVSFFLNIGPGESPDISKTTRVSFFAHFGWKMTRVSFFIQIVSYGTAFGTINIKNDTRVVFVWYMFI